MDFLNINPYETYLTPIQELLYNIEFNKMKQNRTIHPSDIGQDYDFRAIYNIMPMYSSSGHFPDYGKKPNHPTFSIESKYATGENKKYAGTWNGDNFIPPAQRYKGY